MRPRLSHFFGGLIIAAAVLIGSPSKGQTIYTGTGYTAFNYSGAPLVTIVKPAGGGPELTLSNDFTTYLSPTSPLGSSIDTYCIDIYHNNNQYPSQTADVKLIVGSSFSNTRDNPTDPTAYGKAGLGRAAWLVNTYAKSAGVDKVALQLAVWKAEYETYADTANYTNLSAGDLQYTGFGGTQTQLDDAKKYLQASITAGGGHYANAVGIWVSYYKDGYQDQLTALPEPASLAMSGTALLAVAGLALRRRKARVAQA